MVDIFDVLDLVEGDVETLETYKVFESANVRDQIVVEVEIL